MTPEVQTEDPPPTIRELFEIQQRVAVLVDDLAAAVADLRETIDALSLED